MTRFVYPAVYNHKNSQPILSTFWKYLLRDKRVYLEKRVTFTMFLAALPDRQWLQKKELKLSSKSFKAMRQDGLPKQIRESLQNIKDKVLTEDEFKDAIEKLLGKSKTAQYQEAIIKNTHKYEYKIAKPNLGNLSEVKTASSILAPESYDPSTGKEVYENSDDPTILREGNSMGAAYLLAKVNCFYPTQWDCLGGNFDVACTGVIVLPNGEPFLSGVTPIEFSAKFQAFIFDERFNMFIVPATNIELEHKELCKERNIRVISVDDFEKYNGEDVFEQKTIVQVHGYELRKLVGIIFRPSETETSSDKISQVESSPLSEVIPSLKNTEEHESHKSSRAEKKINFSFHLPIVGTLFVALVFVAYYFSSDLPDPLLWKLEQCVGIYKDNNPPNTCEPDFTFTGSLEAIKELNIIQAQKINIEGTGYSLGNGSGEVIAIFVPEQFEEENVGCETSSLPEEYRFQKASLPFDEKDFTFDIIFDNEPVNGTLRICLKNSNQAAFIKSITVQKE